MSEPVEGRRITGVHPLLPAPGAAVELAGCGEAEVAAIIARARVWWALLGWPEPTVRQRAWTGDAAGVTLALTAPPWGLYGAVEALERAVAGGATPEALEAVLDALESESVPGLPGLLARDDLGPVLVDDEAFTLGLGAAGTTWALDDLPPDPAPGGRIPVAFVTGTNGKTTTTRMIAAIARAGGHTPGFTSSDGIQVGDETLDHGDTTGPHSARVLLRDPRVTLAVLETARGGLMRRGLALTGAECAVLTNVSADHLGEWGLHSLEDLAWAKSTVVEGVSPDGVVVVGAREPILRAAVEARRGGRALRTFAAEPDPSLDAWADDAGLHLRHDGGVLSVPYAQVPATWGGLARHNVANALAAGLAALALGLSADDIAAGWAAFRPDAEHSRGRLNRYARDGVTVWLDFAHNAAGIAALAPLVDARAGRLAVTLGQAGDRTDALIDATADAVLALGPDRVALKELPAHRRGRAEGEVRARLRARARAHGLAGADVSDHHTEVEALDALLGWARDGDVVLLLAHEEVDSLLERLAAWEAGPPA